jgi:hypothetical protein
MRDLWLCRKEGYSCGHLPTKQKESSRSVVQVGAVLRAACCDSDILYSPQTYSTLEQPGWGLGGHAGPDAGPKA